SDLGFYLLCTGTRAMSADDWRAGLSIQGFAADCREHLEASDAIAQQFARVAQTGLMVLRNPPGRRLKVGGRDWSERRLYAQIRSRVADFVLLRQAECEATSSSCDVAAAVEYMTQLAHLPICMRRMAQPSP